MYTTPEILDVTAVKIAEIHEAAETDRKKVEYRKAKWTNTEFLTSFSTVSIVSALCLLFGSMFYSCQKYHKESPPQNECQDTYQVVADNTKAYCAVGAVLETKAIEDRRGFVEQRCICKKQVANGP